MLIVRCGFLGLGSGHCRIRRLDRSTALKAMVANVGIVGMRLWSWVLRLLLLLLLKGSVVNVTCVAKWAICDMTALRQRARESRSRQKTPEACTKSVTRAFSERHVQAEACGCAFEACHSAKCKLVYQVVTCTFCGSVHVDKGKYKKFNHASHKSFH